MSGTWTPQVQFVISNKFIALFLLALSLLGGGYYWYSQQQQVQEHLRQTQERFKAPPYFINRGVTVMRDCGRCLELGKLKPQPEWKIGPPTEIPATEQRWFLAVEDPPMPVAVSGVLMLPIHPAFQDNPSFGFDQSRVELVLYQNLQRMPAIEQLKPPVPTPSVSQSPQPETPPSDTAAQSAEPANAASSDNASSPATIVPWQSSYLGDWKNVDSDTVSLTRLLITSDGDKLLIHAWSKCVSEDCDWGTATVDSPQASKQFLIVWDRSYAYYYLEVTLDDGGRLRVSVKTRYVDRSAHVDTGVVLYFTHAIVA